MSGISGTYSLDGRPAEEFLLRRMTASIVHRGPDGIRHWMDGPVGFGHLALQTTPESVIEKQPLTNADSTLCLTMDGRIDNRSELRHLLESHGFSPRHDTDAELVLQAYECWKENCPGWLIGDFAFAVWDARKGQLFCARDYVGVRPFYYYRSASVFAFASEIRSLLVPGLAFCRLNESRLVDFLIPHLDRDDEESTFYQGVLRLPAGHSLTVGSGGRFAIRDYWDLKAPATLKLSSLGEYGEAFREVFVEAVRCRLRSIHPVGATLSGGVDSSSVVCTTREMLATGLKEPLHTISLVDADESMCGETPYIREVLQGGRLIPHIVRSDQVSAMTEQMTGSDEPFEIANYFPNWYNFATVSKAGVRVLLDGVSGDHVTPPYTYLATLVRSLKWSTLHKELAFGSKYFRQNPFSALASDGLGPIMPGLLPLWRWLRRRKPTPNPEDSIINRDFALRMGISERMDLRRNILWKASQDIGTLHAWSFTNGVLPFFFEHSGRLAATMGVEPRHPFSDRRVIEFFLSLPLEMKTYSPLPKRVIRAGMEGLLPEKVRLRTRYAHPGAAFMDSLFGHHSRDLEVSRFRKLLDPLRQYVSVERVDTSRQAVIAGSRDDGDFVWAALNLALWAESSHLQI